MILQVNEPKFDFANITDGFFLKGEEKYHPQTNERKKSRVYHFDDYPS